MEAADETTKRGNGKVFECVECMKLQVECKDIQVECDKENFCQRSIIELNWKLREEEDNHTKKLVHLLVNRIIDSLKDKESWLEFGLESDGHVYFSCIDHFMSANMPKELKELTEYGCAFMDSKIIIVGGRSRKVHASTRPGFGSNQVFIYDTVKEVWETHQMNARRCQPTVVAVDNKIFVFGGRPEDPTYQWGEYFDFGTNSWKFFPQSPPAFILPCSTLALYALCQKQHMVLFSTPLRLIVSFDYNSWKWDTYGQHMTITRDRGWNLKVAVLEDFLFWNDSTTIYAHDLNGRVTLPVCTLPTLPFRPSTHSEYSHVALICSYDKSFLVHIGNGMLCLLGMTNDHQIWYITFLIKISWSFEATTIHLVADRTGFLGTPVIKIYFALEDTSEGEIYNDY